MSVVRKVLICRVQDKIVELGCRENYWRSIGKRTGTIYLQREILLNIKWLLGFGSHITEEQVASLDCYYKRHFGNG
jgi:hypothetical protein